MILHRIRLANYRGIEDAEVELHSRGITLVEGPNEIGKSSLHEALDLVFEFPDSSRHGRVEAVVPTHRDAGPEIEVELETGAYHVVYTKRYRKRPETRLEVRAPRKEMHTGREAHDRMREILDETLDTALLKALQVVQGERIDQPALTDSAALRRALDTAAGGDATDDAGDLFARVEEEYLRSWTRTGQPHRERRAKDDAVHELEGRIQELQDKQRELEGDVRRYEELTARAEGLEGELPDLERTAEVSSKDREALVGLRQQVERAAGKAQSARADLQIAEGRLRERTQALDKIADLEEQLAALSGEEATEADQALAAAREAEQDHESRVQALRDETVEAEALARLRSGDLQLRQDELQQEQLGERRRELERLESRAQVAREALGRRQVDAAALQRLREADVAVASARAGLEAAGVKVGLRALASVDVELSGEHMRLDAGSTRDETVTERATLVVIDQLEVGIEPGRGLGELRGRLDAAEEQRTALLRDLGVADIDEAVAAEQDRREAARTLEEVELQRPGLLRDLDFDELVAKHERQKQRVARYLEVRSADPPLPASLEEARERNQEASDSAARARNRLEEAEAELASARERRGALERERTDRTARTDMLSRQRAEAERRLAQAREQQADDALAVAAEEARARSAAAERAQGALEAELADRNPEAIEARAESDAGALARARRDQVELGQALATLRGRLETERESGVSEQLEREHANLDHERDERARLERRASATKLLFESLREARDAARRAYVQPLTGRIESLGRIVYGESFAIELGDDLAIRARTLDGVTVPFAGLSSGAKEQLGILVRLAVALAVSEDGGVPVVLDDTLGHTDPARLRAMGAVLGRVGRVCQILVLTCTPERFRALGGVRVVSLGRP